MPTTTSRKRFLAPYPQFADYLRGRGRWMYPSNGRILDPDYFVIDFNLRPSTATLDARDSFNTSVDWNAAVEKAVGQVRKIFSRCGFSGTRADVEGICDDGTMACVLILPKPHAAPLKAATKLLHSFLEVGVDSVRLLIVTMDKENKKQVLMIAEDFYLTPSKAEGTIPGTIPFREWSKYADRLEAANR